MVLNISPKALNGENILVKGILKRLSKMGYYKEHSILVAERGYEDSDKCT